MGSQSFGNCGHLGSRVRGGDLSWERSFPGEDLLRREVGHPLCPLPSWDFFSLLVTSGGKLTVKVPVPVFYSKYWHSPGQGPTVSSRFLVTVVIYLSLGIKGDQIGWLLPGLVVHLIKRFSKRNPHVLYANITHSHLTFIIWKQFKIMQLIIGTTGWWTHH